MELIEGNNKMPAKIMIMSRAQEPVARLVCKGLKNDEIAEALNLSSKTVKYHLTNIYKRNGLRNRTELMREMMKTDE